MADFPAHHAVVCTLCRRPQGISPCVSDLSVGGYQEVLVTKTFGLL